MTSTTVTAIFWGAKWAASPATAPTANAAFTADKISGLDTWHRGYGNRYHISSPYLIQKYFRSSVYIIPI